MKAIIKVFQGSVSTSDYGSVIYSNEPIMVEAENPLISVNQNENNGIALNQTILNIRFKCNLNNIVKLKDKVEFKGSKYVVKSYKPNYNVKLPYNKIYVDVVAERC